MNRHNKIPEMMAKFLEHVPVGYVFDMKAALLGTAVGVGGTMSALGRWLAPGYFLVALLTAMTLELLSCYLSKDRPARRDHDWERAFIGKLFIVFLAVCALLLDGALYFGVNALPVEAKVIGSGVLPVTLSSLVWFLIAEVARTVKNIANYEGSDSSIPPVILWFIRQVRKVDEARFPGHEGPPPRRWTDDLTEEDIRELMQKYKDHPAANDREGA